ncbi:MAG TPA: hypothetical protein VHO70_00315 [Chitinispirillaceae bacterium]|nr:hypothetical protein [Chitinispirillaceae bacterium]
MHFRLLNDTKIHCNIFFIGLTLLTGCQPPGVVVNLQKFETHLNSVKLCEYPSLKVYYGGALSEIPLKSIKELNIDHSLVVQYEDELYFGARIVLKDGTAIQPSQKESKLLPFVSIQNTISGKRGSEKFSIGLKDVSRIEIK